ncbi:MAG TPA: fasciclin domain-containing protein [Tepidisphaeraceae bacterium]|nr:fasciclin domain-containing protein [Tepidisphaeraceae bacterium]
MRRNQFALSCALGLSTIAGAVAYSSGPAHAEDMPAAHADHGMTKDIIDTATGPGMQEVTTVVTAIKAADLVSTLKGPGPFTVFAPTNAAFAKLPAGTVEDLLKPENKDKLRGILLYHVHAGSAIKAADVKTMSLSTANGKPLAVKADGGGVMLNDARVIKTDVVATNGVIHWIDTVLLP